MSQRDSGYARKERDLYETPEWVTEAVLLHLPRDLRRVWEPAAGNRKMARVLVKKFQHVADTDIDDGLDFLQMENYDHFGAIITNPPYALAREFIEHALDIMRPAGVVAMLLRTDFDHAKSRCHLFGGCEHFAKKVVLTRRIKWFEDSKGQPSFNHAWFIWDYQHRGRPTLAYE